MTTGSKFNKDDVKKDLAEVESELERVANLPAEHSLSNDKYYMQLTFRAVELKQLLLMLENSCDNNDKIHRKQVGGSHYESFAIQPIDIIRANNLGFIEGNCLKYLLRFKKKNGLEDLEKLKWYVNTLIDEYEKDNLKDNY